MYRPLASDIRDMAEAVAAAMFEDPLHRHLLPDPQRRKLLLPRVYAFGLRRDRVYASSPAPEGVATRTGTCSCWSCGR